MTFIEGRIEGIKAQIEQHKVQIEQHKVYLGYWQTVVLSGSYKNRMIYHGTDGELLSTEELLDHHIAIIDNHVKLITDLTENLIKLTSSQIEC